MLLLMLVLLVVVYLIIRGSWEHKPRCESPIEWRLYNALKRRGYEVKTQVRCGAFRIDLALPQYRVAIECDGHAFHSSPSQKSRDRRRTAYLYRNGWNSVLRFTGSEINRDVEKCVDRIESKIFKG
jgi:very-short-patch-repair endonuclease